MKVVSAAVFSLVLVASSAFAASVSGTFKAVSACDAYKSFNKGTNPGLVHTIPGKEYEIVEVNDKEMSWVRIKVPNVKDNLRWVAGECGTKEFAGGGGGGGGGGEGEQQGKKNCRTKNQYDSYVLAMSWQPAFCKYVAAPGAKPECEAMHDGELVIDHLTIHGLWPNKTSCGESYGNCGKGNEQLNLDETTVSQLSPWMPNFYFEQDLGMHEWQKHGTCQPLPDDQYFLTAMRLVKAVDESAVGAFIKSKVGGSFTEQEFFTEIANAYGQDVADRITLVCTKNKYLQEIRLDLPPKLGDDTELTKLTAGGPKAKAHSKGCGGSIYIERSGFGPGPAQPVGPL